jgi:carboxymethylenebutenolidase
MRHVTLFLAAMAIAAPTFAQQAPARGAAAGRQGAPGIDVPWNDALPPGTADHATRALQESSRHGEWVDIKLPAGGALRSWVTYPERSTKAAVVLVIHDIRGMSDIARAMGDQLSQDGFIAIVPDFLSGRGPNGGGTESLGNNVGQAIMALTPDVVNAGLDAAMAYGKSLPSSNGKTAVIGFCWGGARSFGYAAAQPGLAAAVVYYGEAPGAATAAATEQTVAGALSKLQAPVLGLYAGNDNRIDSTIPVTQAAMKRLGKSYDVHVFEGAGHGFMFAQAGANGANLKAARDSWPLVLQFYRSHLQ